MIGKPSLLSTLLLKLVRRVDTWVNNRNKALQGNLVCTPADCYVVFSWPETKVTIKKIPFQQILARSRRNVNLQISGHYFFDNKSATTSSKNRNFATRFSKEIPAWPTLPQQKNISVAVYVTDITEIDIRGDAWNRILIWLNKSHLDSLNVNKKLQKLKDLIIYTP